MAAWSRQRGEQRVLFSMAGYREVPFGRVFGVSPDDRRFLMVRPKAGVDAERSLVPVVVENWLEEVKRIMKGR